MGFISIIAEKVAAYKKATKAANSGFSSIFSKFSSSDTSATDVFIAEIDKCGSWNVDGTYTPRADDKHGVACALFKYCIARYSESTSSPLFDSIIKELPKYASITIEEQDTFFKDILAILNAQKRKLELSPMELIPDINSLTLSLFSTFGSEFEEKQIQLLLDAQLIESCFLPHFKVKGTAILDHPLMIKALQKKPELGIRLMEQIIDYGSDGRIENGPFIFESESVTAPWLWLLKNKAIAPDAIVQGRSFLQTWHRIYQLKSSINPLKIFEGFSAFAAIFQLLEDNILKEVPASTKNMLFSIVYKEGRTPLQELAKGYAFTKRADIIDLIIRLLEQQTEAGFSVAHEKDPLWIETLLEYLNDESAWDKIMRLIPQAMWNEFFTRKLHLTLSEKLLQKLNKEDFWTQSLVEQRSSGNTILIKVIERIIKDKEFTLDKRLAFYKENHALLDRPHTFFDEITDSPPVTTIHQVSNAIKEQVLAVLSIAKPQAWVNNAPVIIEGINDAHKRELCTSIEKSLITLEENIVIYPDPQPMIEKISVFSNNIANILIAYQLDFEEMIFANPRSHFILKNILTNLAIFVKKESDFGFYQTDFYKKMNLPMTFHEPKDSYPFSKFLRKLARQTQEYRSNFIRLNKKDNHINRNASEFLQHEVVDVFHEETKDGRECDKLIHLCLKAILQIIDYRIISYTQGEKYEKGFYREYLEGNVYVTPDMVDDLEPYKPFIIAQINISLKKLKPKDYQTHERATALNEYLSSLKNHFAIEISELDSNAHDVYYDLNVIIAGFENIEKENDPLFLRKFFKADVDDGKLERNETSAQDVKKFIDCIFDYHVEMCSKGDYKKVLDLKYVDQALAIKKDGFDAAKYFLERSQKAFQPQVFIAMWVKLMSINKTDKTEMNKKHFWIHTVKAYENPIIAYKTLLENLSFRNVSPALKTKLFSTPIYSENDLPLAKIIFPQYQDKFYTQLVNYQSAYALHDDVRHGISRQSTFNHAKWSCLYDKQHAFTKTDRFTPLQFLAFQYLIDEKIGPGHLEIISCVLGQNPDIDEESDTHGSWLDILLVGMHDHSIDGIPDPFINLLHFISDKMSVKIFTKEKRHKMADLLMSEMNPLIDSKHDTDRYQLYFTALLIAAFRPNIVQETINDPQFITKICFLLMRSNDNLALEYLFVTLNHPEELLKLIKTQIEKNIINPTMVVDNKTKEGLCNIFNIQLKVPLKPSEYSIARSVCVAIKETLFLELSKRTSIYDHWKDWIVKDMKYEMSTLGKVLDDNTKEAIYQSCEKVILYTLEFAKAKWRDDDFVIAFFEILNFIVCIVHLDHKRILSDKTSKILEHYLWTTTYQSKAAELPANFANVFAPQKKQLLVLLPQDNPKVDQYIQSFIDTIVINAKEYNKKSWKPLNGHNKGCAEFIANLKNTAESPHRTFIKAIVKIIDYRLRSFTEIKYEKSFYRECLAAPLQALSQQAEKIPFSDFYKQNLYYEITDILQEMMAEVISDYDIERRCVLRESLDLFVNILDLGEKFKDFDYSQYGLHVTRQQLAASSSTVIVSNNKNITNNSNNNNSDSNNNSHKI